MKRKTIITAATLISIIGIINGTYAENPNDNIQITEQSPAKAMSTLDTEMRKINKQMDNYITDPLYSSGYFIPANHPVNSHHTSSPVSRFHEKQDKYILQVVTPGMSKNDLKVQIKNNSLIITGSYKNEVQHEQNNILYNEKITKEFTKSFSIPANADKAKISSTYKNGILTVILLKNTAKISNTHYKY